jgi:hypothetical protein
MAAIISHKLSVRSMLSPLHTRSNKSAISLARYSIISSFLRGAEQNEERDSDVNDVTAYIHSHKTPFTCPNTDTKHTHADIYSGEGEGRACNRDLYTPDGNYIMLWNQRHLVPGKSRTNN